MRPAWIFIAALLSACTTAPITSVAVLDANFKVVKQLNPTDIARFDEQWRAKVEVETPLNAAGGKHYKLDIEREDDGGRWLYQTTGYVQLLSALAKPVYKIPDHTVFNELIGVTQ